MTVHVSDDLLADAARVLPTVVALRRALHHEPELGLQLPRTQERVVDALDGLPIEPVRGTAVTSVVADLHGEAGDVGRTVLLRADMDALPMPEDTGLEFASSIDGVMHACGHDAHTAMLVGAACLLAARRASFAGTIRFMFQPGEEGYGGARSMIDEGVIDGVDGAFALHVSPNLPSGAVWTRGGPLMASADVLRITVTGRGGHASTPYLASDPMPVAAEIVQALQVMVTRRINAFDPVVATITQMNAGSTDNVIPEDVRMVGTLRAVSEASRKHAIESMHRLVEGIAAAHDMQAELHVHEGYPVTVNDDASAQFMLRVARDLVGADATGRMPSPVMGAEDFSYVLQRVPGALAFLGVCPPGEHPARAHACHSNRMVLDEDALAAGTAMYAALALKFLANGVAEAAR